MKLTKTHTSTLYRADSGVYIMRCKLMGRIVQRSLETHNAAIARQKLPQARADALKQLEEQREEESVDAKTMGGLMAAWQGEDATSPEIKQSTKDYHVECVQMLQNSWPELAGAEAKTVTERDCLEWAARFRRKYSATRYNGTVDILRRVFALAVARGLRVSNPAKAIPKASVKAKELHLPSHENFRAMMEIAAKGKLRGEAFDVIRFLAYTGMRVNEAGQVVPEMVDWKRMEIHLPGRITKNGLPRHVPIIPELEPVLRRLCESFAKDPNQKRLLPARDPRRCLKTLCRLVGIPEITNHDLRHLFATRCIEAGVDVKTIAAWMGHQDGGALLLKTYAHLRNEHSREMAAKVKFG